MVYAIMSRRSQPTYEACFDILLGIAGHQNITLAMADFESSLRKAIATRFPQIVIVGCSSYHDRVNIFQIILLYEQSSLSIPIFPKLGGEKDLL